MKFIPQRMKPAHWPGLHGLQALQNDYPDAEFVAQKVDVTTENDMLHYRVVYTIIADICT